MFVIDDGWNVRLFVGSGNSTSAAMGSAPRNVEFMVELSGRKSRFGIDTLLKPGEDGNEGTFRSLIEPFDKSELGTVPEDGDATNLELTLEAAAASLARADVKGHVEIAGDRYGHVVGSRRTGVLGIVDRHGNLLAGFPLGYSKSAFRGWFRIFWNVDH